MSRISFESGTLMLLIEALARNSFYYYEAKLCTINTENTISSLIQGDVNQSNLYKKHNTELRRWHNSYAWNNSDQRALTYLLRVVKDGFSC